MSYNSVNFSNSRSSCACHSRHGMLTDRLKGFHDFGVVDHFALGAVSDRVKQNIVHRQDAFQLSFRIDHRQTPDMMFLHRLQRPLDALVEIDAVNLTRHHFFNGNAGWISVSDCGCHADVAVGDHADDFLTILNDRQHTTIVLPHHLRSISQTASDPNGLCVWRHNFFDFHETNSSLPPLLRVLYTIAPYDKTTHTSATTM